MGPFRCKDPCQGRPLVKYLLKKHRAFKNFLCWPRRYISRESISQVKKPAEKMTFEAGGEVFGHLQGLWESQSGRNPGHLWAMHPEKPPKRCKSQFSGPPKKPLSLSAGASPVTRRNHLPDLRKQLLPWSG